MTALGRARGKIGEQAGIPMGASCAVSEGEVTILDAVARRQYVLSPTSEALSSPPNIGLSKSTPPAAGLAKQSKKTVAYIPAPGATLAGRSKSAPPPSTPISSRPLPISE